MSLTGLKAFDSTIHTTNLWLHELMEESDLEDRHQAYHALRAVLHALRDQLTVDESVNFAAQLPMLVRGFFYEGWKPSKVPLKERKRSEFLNHVSNSYSGVTTDEIESITRAVFRLLEHRISKGEIAGVEHLLSEELRGLWPSESTR